MKHTKLTSLLLVLAMTITSMVLFVTPATAASNVWEGDVATSFAGGSGTEADPYQIANGAQLAYLRQLAAGDNAAQYTGLYYVLTADIYLNADSENYASWLTFATDSTSNPTKNLPEEFNVWTSVFLKNAFTGTIDGRGHTVYGIYTDAATRDSSTSLFGHIKGGTVKNVKVSQSFICNLAAYAGYAGAIASNLDGGLIDNCHVSNVKIRAHGNVGGIAAYAGNQAAPFSTIQNCTFEGELVSWGSNGNDSVAGGIVGTIGNWNCTLKIDNCQAFGRIVSSFSCAGGMISGRNKNNYPQANTTYEITNCINFATVEGKVAGGIVSRSGSRFNTIYNCANFGTVTGVDFAGGCIGDATELANIKLTNFVNAGSVSATGEAGVAGGVIGNIGKNSPITLQNAVNAVAVSGAQAGSVFGAILTGVTSTTVADVYYDSGAPIGAASAVEFAALASACAPASASAVEGMNAYVETWNANAGNLTKLSLWTYGASSIDLYAASVTLGDALSVNLFTKEAEALTFLPATLKIDGEAVEGTVDGDYVKYTLSDIKASELDKVYAITVEQAGIELQSFTYGISTYIERMTGKSAELDAVLSALATYGAAAKGEDVDVDAAYAALNLAPVENVDGTYATAIALVLTDSVRPIVKVVDGVAQVKVEMYGETFTYDVVDGEVIIDCVTATSLNNVMTLTFVDADGTELGSTNYAIANYIKQAESLDLAKALAVYMQAVRTYNGLID